MAYELHLECREFFAHGELGRWMPGDVPDAEQYATTVVHEGAGFHIWYRWRCGLGNPCPFPLFHERYPVNVLHVCDVEMPVPPGVFYELLIDRTVAELALASPLNFIIPVVHAELADQISAALLRAERLR